MARARNIKPGLFKNEVLGVADTIYTLLFEGLWVLADREGRLEDRPLRIKGEIFPYREGVNIDEMLNWLQGHGFIRRYEKRGKRCIVVCEFAKHQNPHKNESASELPAPDDDDGDSDGVGTDSEKIGTTRADSLYSDSLYSDSLQQHHASADACAGDGDQVIAAKRSGKVYTQEFEQAWAAYPQRPNNSKADAFKAWNARIRSGVSPDSLIAGVERYAAYCKTDVSDPRYIKQAATFFGPAEHYLEEWKPTLRGAPPGKPGGVRHNGFNGVDYRKGVNDDGTFD